MKTLVNKLNLRVPQLSLRDFAVVVLPLTVLVVLAFWATWHFVKPAPPSKLVIATGPIGSSYQQFAAQYRDTFKKNGVTLVELPTEGSEENIRRLLQEKQVDVGFVQGGALWGQESGPLVALSVVGVEPLWIFYKGTKELTYFQDLAGKRVAIGAEGGGARHLGLELIAAHGMDGKIRLSDLDGLDAVAALTAGDLDAVLLVGSAQSAPIWQALYTPGVHLMSMSQAETYPRRYPFLSVQVLPRGAIDLSRNVPPVDTKLIATRGVLVARDDLHPALVDLMIQAAQAVHSKPGLFQTQGAFPSLEGVDVPVSSEAERHFKSGLPFLQRYLPFWAATLFDRLLVLLIPILAILLPVLRLARALYSWRIRSRVVRIYGELKLLELEFAADQNAKTPAEWVQEIDSMEERANATRVPLAFSDLAYTLRSHVQMVKAEMLQRLHAPEAEATMPSPQ